MAASATSASKRVRALNDQLRQHRIGGEKGGVILEQGAEEVWIAAAIAR